MGFWQGFGDGFVGGYQQSFDAAERRKLFMEETNNKKKQALAPLKTRALERLSAVEEQKGMLTYLQGRKLPENVINALYEDPEMLQQTYEFVRTKAADMDGETLSNIFQVSNLGNSPTPNAFELLEQAQQSYMDLISGGVEDPDAWVDPSLVPRPRTAVIESRLPKTEDELGISAVRDRTWKIQADTYDKAIMTMANTEINALNRKKDSNTLDSEGFTRLTQLQEWSANYDKDSLSMQRLRELYGEQAKGVIMNNPSMTPETLAFFESNPMIFDFGAEARAEAQQRAEIVTQGVLVGQGVDPSDGRNTRFYQMPDGSLQTIKD
jgi:hypothetical protein